MVRQTYRRVGAGYLRPAEYYNPSATQPSGPAGAPSPFGTQGWIRAPLAATDYVSPAKGGKRSTRKQKKQSGGFAPALMGAFAANAQTAVVPLALLALYAAVGAKYPSVAKTNNVNKSRKGGKRN